MKYINRILAAVMTLAAFAVASCQKESTVAKAVLVSESYLTCPAEEAPDQFIKVYADADWVCDAPEWITVSPASGTGTMDVTLSFADNLRDGAIDNPRKDTIIFRGTTLASYAYLVIQQEGDKYRDLQQKDLTEIAAEPNEAFVYAKESQVVALATDGFVVTDAQTTMFVQSATLPEIGDKVTFYGYVGEINGLKVVTRCEKLQTNSNSAVTYPVENNVTATFDSYTSKAVEYITLDGVYEGGQLKVNDATTKHCLLYNPIESLGLADLNGHKITVKGYHAGTVGSTVYVIVVSVVDNGVDEIIYFSDNFDWVADLANEAGAGDSMGAKGDNNAKNAYTAVEGFAELLASQGYEDLFPTSKTIYLQKNYLKFSKGKNVNGIKLPAVTYGGTTNVVLTFDWGVHVGGGGPDKVNLVIEVEGNGEVVESGFDHTAGDWTWQSQTVHINGVDDETRILIKPSTFEGEESSGYYRWYLDNIKIVQGEGAAPSVSKTLATFPFPYDTGFTGEDDGAGVKWNLTEGWLLSEEGDSKLSSHNADGSSLKFTYKYEASDDGGLTKDHVRVLATGMQKGGYWLFEVPVKDMPAGTYNIKYKHSASATGPNYFLMEVSVDGQTWLPAEEKTTTETYKDGTGGREVTWTYALNKGGVNDANVACDVEVDYSAPALPGENKLYIRAKIADDMAYGATRALGTKGTNRIWGPCEVTFGN